MPSLRQRRGRVASVLVVLALSGVASAETPTVPSHELPESEQGPASPDPLFRPLVTPELAKEAIDVALRAAGHPLVRRTLASLAARARSAAALPEVWLRGSHSTNDALNLAPTIDDPYHYSSSGGIGWLFEARLIWHLDRLIFEHDEISVERLRADREGDAARLTNKVVETLFAWQRASLRARDPKSSADDLEAAELARTEAEIVLDVLTNGWFSERIRQTSAR